MNKSRYLIVIALIFFTNIAYSFDIENKILIKIDNEIITSLDIQNEYKYLIALNPDIKKSNKEDIIKLQKDQFYKKELKKLKLIKILIIQKYQKNF